MTAVECKIPYFSVIILNWNGEQHLTKCLDSLRNQSFPYFDVVLVDNGSTDSSVELVKTGYAEVKLLALKKNLGFAAGVNAGIRASFGEYVVLLNNDTEAAAAWLEQLAAAINAHPDVAVFASKLVNYYDRNLIDSAGDGMDLYRGPYKMGENEPVEIFRDCGFIFGACGGGGCYQRTLFAEIGLFDEEFFAYFEDSDLSFRANWAAFRCLSVPDAVIYHKVGGTSDTDQASRDRFDIMRRRNLIFLTLKNYPATFLARYIPFILATHCAIFLANLLRGRFRVAFQTQWEILKGLPGMLGKRRRILSHRRITNKEMASRCEPRHGRSGFAEKRSSPVAAP